MALILLVEDEDLLRWGVKRQLERHEHVVDEAPDLQSARRCLAMRRPDVVLLDLGLPDGSGLDFLAEERETLSESLVIVVTAVDRVETAVKAMKLGAFDFLAKPLKEEEILAVVDRALGRQREKAAAERERRERVAAEEVVVAESPEMKKVLKLADAVAQSEARTVLITGETGVGKEVVARYIHAHSARADGPLVAVNCSALPEQLAESELFGYDKGAFTGAGGSKKGIFELAHLGTVILDEISDLSAAIQAKLLRILESCSVRRLGGTREILLDVRVLALANRDLGKLAVKGEFRPDLFHRLNIFPIVVPPLTSRREDIVPLAEHFLKMFEARSGKQFGGFSKGVQKQLLDYDWPGNVRELSNTIERLVILSKGDNFDVSLPVGGEPTGGYAAEARGEVRPLAEIEAEMIRRALTKSGGNQSAAAKLLGISRDQLRYRLNRERREDSGRTETDEASKG